MGSGGGTGAYLIKRTRKRDARPASAKQIMVDFICSVAAFVAYSSFNSTASSTHWTQSLALPLAAKPDRGTIRDALSAMRTKEQVPRVLFCCFVSSANRWLSPQIALELTGDVYDENQIIILCSLFSLCAYFAQSGIISEHRLQCTNRHSTLHVAARLDALGLWNDSCTKREEDRRINATIDVCFIS